MATITGENGSRTGVLAAGALRPRLVHYPPGLRHAAHSHDVPHVSVLVAGSVRETTSDGDEIVCHGRVGFRADGARHSVCFGPAGALILTVETDEWLGGRLPRSGVRWLGASARFARELLALVRTAEVSRAEVTDRLLDVWAVRRDGPCDAGREPPLWLRRAAEQLLAAPQEVSVSELARRLGVHRVHLARAFHQYFGMAPSLFRRRAMTSRAISAALAGHASFACAAAEAGFADQSHMSRSVREWCGMGLGDLKAVLGRQVTSVQSGRGALL